MNRAITIASSLLAISPVFAGDIIPASNLDQSTHPVTITTDKPISNNRYIVMFKQNQTKTAAKQSNSVFGKSGFSSNKASDLIKRHGGKVKSHLKSISSIATELTPAQLKQLKAHPEVKLIEADVPRSLSGQVSPYGLALTQADLLSDAATGNQKVCIIDTGYRIDHEDLMSGANVTGEVSNTLSTEVDLGEWSTDSYGHGSHMAGTISALDNAVGVKGVNPGGVLNLHIVKMIHHPGWYNYLSSDVVAAVALCEAAGATVINMSLAGQSSSVAEQQAVDHAYNNGAVLVSASGNRGNSTLYYPASYDSVISAGAVDAAGDAWRYTQVNDKIELAAPGVNVRSTVLENGYGGYANWDGTSVATAYISGVTALVWSHHPQCTNVEIRDALQRSALDRGTPGRDDTYGNGIVQAKAASDLLTSEGCAADTPVVTRYTDPVEFANTTNVESIPGLTTGLVPGVWVTEGIASGVRCIAAGGFSLQSGSDRIVVQTGSFSYAFDIGVTSVSFNAYLQGAITIVTVKTASGATQVFNLTADGFVGLTSDDPIVEISLIGADGLELSDLSRNVGENVTPINTATASSFWNIDPPSDAIDGQLGNNVYAWISSNVDPAPWLKLDTSNAITATHYRFSRGYCNAEAYFAGSWTVYGSNDNLSWTSIDTVPDQSAYFPIATACTKFGPTYQIENPGSYQYYKFDFTASPLSSTTGVSVGEIQLLN